MAAAAGPPFLDGAGSCGPGAESPSAAAGRCGAATAEAACAATGWSGAAGTEVWVRAAASAPGWRGTTAGLGPGGAATGPSAEAAGGSWDCRVGPATRPGRGVATYAAEFVGKWPGKTEGWVHPG